MSATRNPQLATIFALATAPGRSGIAVIRISGPQAEASLPALGVASPPAPRLAKWARLKESGGETIDDAVLLWFPAPASFTGEDVLELQVHGSRVVIARLTAILSALPGFRPAEPGEFARRALQNGKMDLTEAEGLADLIDAETLHQHRQALYFMQGHASARYQALREHLVRALSRLEACIDFPDEDIPYETLDAVDEDVRGLESEIQALLTAHPTGEKIRDGFHIALLGETNAGKSSLLNVLAKRDMAIVSHVAGTTRDVIELHMDIGGYAVTIADTAGIREHADEIEREGIRRSLERADTADIKIILFDALSPAVPEAVLRLVDEKSVVALNKCDGGILSPHPLLSSLPLYFISAKTGYGIPAMLDSLVKKLSALVPAEPSIISRERHRLSLYNALKHISNFWKKGAIELRCEELRIASRELGRITGAVDIEELLDQIFRQFCIGK